MKELMLKRYVCADMKKLKKHFKIIPSLGYLNLTNRVIINSIILRKLMVPLFINYYQQ